MGNDGFTRLCVCAMGLSVALACATTDNLGKDEGPSRASDAGGSDQGGDGGDSSVQPGDDAEAGTGPMLGVKRVEQACAEGLTLEVSVLDDGVLRVRYVRGTAWPDRGWTHDLSAFAGPTQFSSEEVEGSTTLRTASVELSIASDCSFVATSRDGRELWRTTTPFAAADRTVSITRALREGERIYGLGERTGAADRRGRVLTNWNSDPAWLPEKRYSPTTDPLYQSHPFALSMHEGKAAGFYLANTHRSVFDVGATDASSLRITADDGEMDLFLFDGPRPDDVLERYTRLVGRTPLPPLWALGYHQARWSYTPAARVREVAQTFRDKRLPADGLWLDIDYMDGYRSFTWNPRTFAEPEALIAELARAGFKTTVILDPGIKYDPDNGYGAYDRGIAQSAFILASNGQPVQRKCWPDWAVFPDYSSPGGRTWWGDEVGKLLEESGVRGTWIDMNEPAVFHEDGFPLDVSVAGDGTPTTFAEIKNVYASLMAKATYEGTLARFPDRRPFVLTRAGFAGVQKYSAVWTGDAESEWETLDMVAAQLQGLGVSGVPFVGSDVGGFTGAKSAEMYARWFELGTFSPFFRSHVMTDKPDQEPWAFGEEVEDAARTLLELRYAMLPTWYALFVEAHETGAPPLRPLWWDDPADVGSYAHDDEFFLGSSLLIAPVTTPGATSRKVYLPRGAFVNVHTGTRHEGPLELDVPAPFGKVPMFARAGAVLPAWAARQYVGDDADTTLFLDVYVGPSGSSGEGLVVDDDGETLAYQRGKQSRRIVTSRIGDSGTTIELAARTGDYEPKGRDIRVRLHGLSAAPSGATRDGKALDVAWDATARVATIGWRESAAATQLVITHGSDAPVAKTVSLAITATLPANTPAGDVYLASSALGWKPDGLRLERTGTTAKGTLEVPEGSVVQYKLTRGTWATVEKTAACEEQPNRSTTASADADLSVTVATWSDQCP